MRKLPFIAFGLGALFLFGVGFLAMPKIVGTSTVIRTRSSKSELATAKSLLGAFRNDCGRYPTTEEGLSALEVAPKALQKEWRGPYGSELIDLDPFGNPYVYESTDPNKFSLMSYGADGVEGGVSDNEDLVVTN